MKREGSHLRKSFAGPDNNQLMQKRLINGGVHQLYSCQVNRNTTIILQFNWFNRDSHTGQVLKINGNVTAIRIHNHSTQIHCSIQKRSLLGKCLIDVGEHRMVFRWWIDSNKANIGAIQQLVLAIWAVICIECACFYVTFIITRLEWMIHWKCTPSPIHKKGQPSLHRSFEEDFRGTGIFVSYE